MAQVKVRKAKITELVQDDRNLNKGTARGKELIQKSIGQFGAVRGVAVDRDNRIIAGNKTVENAIEQGVEEIIIVETTGRELVVTKRVDTSLDTKEGREMALADNATVKADLQWDLDEMNAVADDFRIDFGEWGMTEEDESEDECEIIQRKKQEFEERIAAGELGEDDPEYQEFIKKFEKKRTTDDCYTPDVVYDAVAEWVESEYNVTRANFVRPFYPGGDYQHERYKKTDIVVDNPPFSIMSEILNFYHERGIRFFLFAPHLTLFSSSPSSSCTALTIGVPVTYENGANVNTSFLTNLEDPSVRFRSEPRLYAAIKAANEENLRSITKRLPKYAYDHHIITTPFLSALSRLGIDFSVPVSESEQIKVLDSQRESGKGIFGTGYIVSDRVFAEREKAERVKAERVKAEREKAEREKAERWKLSDRERSIIERLNQQSGTISRAAQERRQERRKKRWQTNKT